ncbi:MAG TPA: YCF48-related protein [Ignavibacteria bacterium]|nr:YCF48-related protein [Ignavibacteria bacterium]
MRNIKIFFLVIIISIFISGKLFSQIYRWYSVNLGTTQKLNSISSLYITGNNGTLFYSPTGTIPWASITSGTPNNLLCDFSLTGTKFIGGSNGVILKSTTSQTTFQVVQTVTSNDIRSINLTVAGTTARYVAVGSNGTLLYSTNTGTNWSLVPQVISDNLNYVLFGNMQQRKFGWIAADNGKILRTTNSGDNWTVVNTGFAGNLKSMYYVDSLKIFAVGSGGLIIKTTNGGLNWASLSIPTSADLNAIHFHSFPGNGSMKNGYIAGNNGTILRTIDSGKTWTPNISNTIQNLNSIIALDNELALAVGDNGTLMQRKSDPLYHPLQTFTPNNINTFIKSWGIFNQNTDVQNQAGLQWPAGSNNYMIFTSGLTIAAMVNSELLMAAGSYRGEYLPGYVNSSGQFETNDNMKIYRVSKSDVPLESYDWMNWGLMVPFGAPYVDVNGNFQYDPLVDTPGVKNASQTVFCVMTDANPSSHTLGEGFGGGTEPLNAELRLTAWGYNFDPLKDAMFYKWDIINKSSSDWNGTHFTIYSEGEVGDPNDNYSGCDTLRDMSYMYNGDNEDAEYGVAPPAVGTMFLRTPGNFGMTSSARFSYGASATPCEYDPNGEPQGAYNFMRGFKKDLTPWVIPNTNPPQITKFNYSGDPQENLGWTEFKGSVENCGGNLTGFTTPINNKGPRKQIHSSGNDNQTIHPNQKVTLVIAQLIAKGDTYLNSVTKLKQYADQIKSFYETVNIKNISGVVPSSFELFQNYPNPFNPNTTISFNLPRAEFLKLRVFDITGKEIAILINQQMDLGAYKITWNGARFSSGVYFYKLETPNFTDTKKMVLVK